MAANRQAAAFVLAGGKSSRMGQDKAFLQIDGKTLLDSAREVAATVCDSVSIVGDRDRFGAAAIEDIYPGSGPLAGIHAALTATDAELNLVIAVDTPFLEPNFLEWMLQQAAASQALVTVPRLATGWQPLCAVYRKEFKSIAEDSLKNGRFKIDALFDPASTRAISEAEMKQLAFDTRMFDNLNTRDDFERALKIKK